MASLNIHFSSFYSSYLIFYLFITFSLTIGAPNDVRDVIKFGAKGDGKFDSTQPFLKAWESACSSTKPATIYVPKGRYLLKETVFQGPCKKSITFLIEGTIVAPTDYRALGNSGFWILFKEVDGVTLVGGKFDAKGSGFWACRASPKKCPVGARSITFHWANNIIISSLTSINSQLSHLVINTCNNVEIRNVKLMAPDQSPNTDGIHVEASTGVTITGSNMHSGDDCISIGPGTKNLLMQHIKCGPGHGVSIGSLGKDTKEDGVQNVTLKNAIFMGSDNGVRIKSWARPSDGFVRDVLFQDITMQNVKNPIIIDQNYCPDNLGCPRQTSGIKISDITYRNIQGTSATQDAVTFDCSPSEPCERIGLHNVQLTYKNKAATATCNNIRGTTTGLIIPESSV